MGGKSGSGNAGGSGNTGGTSGGGTSGTSGASGGAGCSGSGCGNVPDPCPSGSFANCGTDCGGRSLCELGSFAGCALATAAAGKMVRTQSAADACKGCSGRMAVMTGGMNGGPAYYRITVSPPWSLLAPPLPALDQSCSLGAQCIIYYQSDTYVSFGVVTADLNAPPRNITIEAANATTTCP